MEIKVFLRKLINEMSKMLIMTAQELKMQTTVT
jgi:hypothetical protein